MGGTNNMRVLGIVGSPRRGGNTEILVDEILAGAAESGADTEKVILNELNISPCQACDACKDGRECIQEDDMSELLTQMERYPIWILGTPVYWWGPSAQLKAFIDRWYGANQAIFKGRTIIVAIPMGSGNKKTAQHVVGMLNDIAGYLGMDIAATVIAPGAYKPGEVSKLANVLAKARQAGKQAVERAS
ncbi:MAG: flavodoxin family protein [Candidatus Thorarchaeota archaeon]